MGCLGCGKDKYIIMALLEQKYNSIPSYEFNIHNAIRDFAKGTHLEDYNTRNDLRYEISHHDYPIHNSYPSQQIHYQEAQYSLLITPYYSVGVSLNNMSTNINENNSVQTKANDIDEIIRSMPSKPRSASPKLPEKKSHNPIPLHYKVIQARENKELRNDLLSKINSSRNKQITKTAEQSLLEMKI